MELLREDQVRPEPGERVFRHGILGPFALWCGFAAPLAVVVPLHAQLSMPELPWFVWLVLGPVLLVGGALYALCLFAVGQVVYRALSSSNWLMRVSPTGVVLKYRSFQNAHFAAGEPTVVRIAWPELARARSVVERIDHGGERGVVRTTWLELEFRGSDTTALERALTSERERPAPQGSFLGIKGRTRFGHVPVLVPRPGVVRVEWRGVEMLRALDQHMRIDAPQQQELALRAAGRTGANSDESLDALEARIRSLCERGERLAAIVLAREELRLSLVDAKTHVERVSRAA